MANQLVDESRLAELEREYNTIRRKLETASGATPDRCWLYHRKKPEGQIFHRSEVEKKMEEGWADSPANIPKPGRPKVAKDGGGEGE